MPARLAFLATLLLAVVLSLCATGGVRAAGSAGLSEQRLAGPRDAGLTLKRVAEHRAAQLEDDDDDLDCKPAAMASGLHAVPTPPGFAAAAAARRACRLLLVRSAAFRARQRLDDSFPTGPPSILR